MFGLKNAVQHLTFVVRLGFGRVEVLRGFRVDLQNTCPKGNYPARHVVNRKHDPPPKPVEDFTTFFPSDGQPGFGEHLGVVAFGLRVGEQGIPLVGAVAEVEGGDGGVGEAALAEVAQANTAPFVGVKETFVKEIFGVVERDVQAFAGGLPKLFFGRNFLFLNLDTVFFGQIMQGLAVVEVLHIHHKPDGIACFSATKTLVNLPRRVDVERR